MALLNPNMFEQVPVRGYPDLRISKRGVLSGQISPNQATNLKAGDFVKLDNTITAGTLPQFVKAASTDIAFGVLLATVQSATFGPSGNAAGALDKVEVMFLTGEVYWANADVTAIIPGNPVESNANGNVQALGTGSGFSQRGIALDYIPANGIGRVMITSAFAAHA